MKKLILMTAFAVTLLSCKSTSVTNTKLDNKTERLIKGNFVVSSVDYPGSEYIKVNAFQLADSQCFVGSTWKFVSNNNKGEMALNSASCTAFSSPIVWSINNQGLFVLKVVEAGTKAKRVREGYLLKVANLTENSFQLIDNISVGGQTKDVTYQFQRAN